MKKLLGIAAILAVLTLTFVGCKPTTGITDDVENKQNTEQNPEENPEEKTEKDVKDLTSEEITDLFTDFIDEDIYTNSLEYFFEDENYYFFNNDSGDVFALSKDKNALVEYYTYNEPNCTIYKKSSSEGDFISLPIMNTAFISKSDYKAICDINAYLDKSATKPILTPQCYSCENKYLDCVLINYSTLAVDNEDSSFSIAVYNSNGELINTHIKVGYQGSISLFSPRSDYFSVDETVYEGLKYGDLAIGELKNLPEKSTLYLEELNRLEEKDSLYYRTLLELINQIYAGNDSYDILLDNFKVLYEIAKY